MTAIDDLCALLDARGVEWDYGISGPDSTMFRANGVDLTFTSMRNGLVCSTILTPGQAVDATLGRGTCHNVEEHPFLWSFTCSECGVHSMTEGCGFNFCPNCGREVVE